MDIAGHQYEVSSNDLQALLGRRSLALDDLLARVFPQSAWNQQ